MFTAVLNRRLTQKNPVTNFGMLRIAYGATTSGHFARKSALSAACICTADPEKSGELPCQQQKVTLSFGGSVASPLAPPWPHPMHDLKPLGIVLAFLCVTTITAAQDGAPEKPGAEELRLKDGRKITILWDRFRMHKFQLYMKGNTAFINNERLTDQSPDVRRIIQWAAEETGIRGDVEQHLKDSIKEPVKLRIVAANPLVLELPYATGVNIRTGKPMALPVCAVEPEDQQLMWDAANKMKVYRAYVAREDDKISAARAAARAAQQAAWAADAAADNTRDILSTLRGY